MDTCKKRRKEEEEEKSTERTETHQPTVSLQRGEMRPNWDGDNQNLKDFWRIIDSSLRAGAVVAALQGTCST